MLFRGCLRFSNIWAYFPERMGFLIYGYIADLIRGFIMVLSIIRGVILELRFFFRTPLFIDSMDKETN